MKRFKIPNDIKASEITDYEVVKNKRRLIQAAMAGSIAGGVLPWSLQAQAEAVKKPFKQSYKKAANPESLELTSWDQATRYNNFYEFGVDKADPAKHAHTLKTEPWNVNVTGACKKPGNYPLESLFKVTELEERIYRHRCVEAWSMVIPWIGIPLGKLIERFEPLSSARFIYFKTLVDPEQMPGQKRSYLPWPYVEALRLDEAMHPLTILATGMYGSLLPNQNGAPLRLIVPWKYGFKGVKSIVEIGFSQQQPGTTWNQVNGREYGFYANVNPEVSHPRWSQKSERKVGHFFRKPTLMFNGYADQVASLYSGMDLRVNY